MTAPEQCVLKHLQGLPHGVNVYIRTHNNGGVLRFTKLTRASWKHTDGFARPGTWIRDDELARLGTITDPPWKERENGTKNP